MMHARPTQPAPGFNCASAPAAAGRPIDVDQSTLRHNAYDNNWSLGDAMDATNAETAAATLIQAMIVAGMAWRAPAAQRGGGVSCPLTVERGNILMAELAYGSALLPSMPEVREWRAIPETMKS